MTTLAVAGVSVRMLAEAAAADGFEVISLDLFGDADTHRASAQWRAIGTGDGLQIDGERLLAALGELAQRGDVQGWIAGSGFDGRPDLLARGAALLPLIGTRAEAVRRVRDPRVFFGFLDEMRITHPAVQMEAPDDVAGWLRKDAGACGGWHIRHASALDEAVGASLESPEKPLPTTLSRTPEGSHRYYERQVDGTPTSATFIANGRSAVVLGFNRLLVRRFGSHPYVYGGAIGPVRLPDRAANDVTAAVRAIAETFSLQGLGSLDFMLDGDAISVLEVNPRPPASMSLYGGGIVTAHVDACIDGTLPLASQETARADAASITVHGSDIVFARRRIMLDDTALARLAAWPHCHDLPNAAGAFEVGDPICSVSATVEDSPADKAAGRVQGLLTERRQALQQFLETLP